MRSLTELLIDFRRSREAMEQLVKNTPRIIGVEAVRVVKQNFLIEGYDSGTGVTKWPPRADATNKAYMAGRGKGKQGRYKGSVFSASKPLLRQTLNLYNSIQYRAYGTRVFIGTNLSLVPYAQAHNQGLNHQPVRQYMPWPNQPPNKKILLAIGKKVNLERDKALRIFKR
jgi:hypothetical protein